MERGRPDKFSPKTKKVLCRRAGNICSNPNCRKITSKPHPTDSSRAINLGIAAHITAAAKGAARYDDSLTSEERKHPDNGIWVCHNCAKEIDSAESTYTIETLQQWKKDAEQYTSLNASSSSGEIEQLLSDIEYVHEEIMELAYQYNKLTDELLKSGIDDSDEYVRNYLKIEIELKKIYNEKIEPKVTQIIRRSKRILGGSISSIEEAEAMSMAAGHNWVGIRIMGERLSSIASELLLR